MSEPVAPASIRFFLAGLALCLCVNALAQSPTGTFAQGREAYIAKDYKTAMRIWSALAKTGDTPAQFALATLYHEGAGVERDPKQATHWFTLAAEQGYAPAQFNLGNAYRRGDGVAQNDVSASEWWKRAADQEFPPAQYNLATQYFLGRGVDKDPGIALIYYRRAAENGHLGAARALDRIEAQERVGSGRGGVSPPVKTASPSPSSRPNDALSNTSAGQDNPVSKPPVRREDSSIAEATSRRPKPSRNDTLKASPVSERATAAAPRSGAVAAPTGSPWDAWVREQPPTWFTIQLLSLGSAPSAQAFIDSRSWQRPVGYVEVVRSGKSYFSVVYGSFETKAQAQAAAKALPAKSRGPGKPWIRDMKGVQALLP